MVNESDVQLMKDKLDQYQQENHDLIQQNLEKEALGERMLSQIMDEEEKEFRERRMQDIQESAKELEVKQRKRDDVIKMMTDSDRPVSEMIEESSQSTQKLSKGTKKLTARGPSLVARMSQLQKRAEASAKQAQEIPFFTDSLESPYSREQLIPVGDRYLDP